jgi:hypothetical protein
MKFFSIQSGPKGPPSAFTGPALLASGHSYPGSFAGDAGGFAFRDPFSTQKT